MARLFRVALGVTLGLGTGCGFTPTSGQPGNDGKPTDDAISDATVDAIPDAAACTGMSKMCLGDTLRVCDGDMAQPYDDDCSWGCQMMSPEHCKQLVPSGGGLTVNDLLPPPAPMKLDDITLSNVTIDTTTGEITGVRAGGNNIISGIYFQVRPGNIGVFRFNKLTISGNVTVIGDNALALASLTTIDITTGEIDVQGDCLGRNAGPGGDRGGDKDGNGAGMGLGKKGSDVGMVKSGGGGAGFGGDGGDGGGLGNSGGGTFGNELITALVGGSGGGGGKSNGGGSPGGLGGGGGGAIQLAANDTIAIGAATINAGGCGGKGGASGAGGGGGGAGGAILIEAPAISLDGSKLTANGGAGGGGGGSGGGGGGSLGGTDGQNGQALNAEALGGPGGGNGMNQGGSGGDGGYAFMIAGSPGTVDSNAGGGGGGGVGRIRFNTRTSTVTEVTPAVISPVASKGPANTQ